MSSLGTQATPSPFGAKPRDINKTRTLGELSAFNPEPVGKDDGKAAKNQPAGGSIVEKLA